MSIAQLSILLAVLTATLPLAGQTYKDPDQPLERRVDDLLARMTLEEKASQLLSASPAIERLGVPAYDWWNECLHGVARGPRHRLSGNHRGGRHLGHRSAVSHGDRHLGRSAR